MKPAVVAKLLEINRQFYAEHARDFADTRERLQPGVRRVQESLWSEANILDLGCGSGTFARALSESGHRGRYLGLDFSAALLDRARIGRYDFPAGFVQADFAAPEQLGAAILAFERQSGVQNSNELTKEWDIVTAFAVLHHVPGRELRIALLEQVRRWLRPAGRLVHSNWRFTSNARIRERVLPWSSVGLNATDVDDGDFLVDWRRGQTGVRYVHEFSEAELSALARETGFRSLESFSSDGVDRHSGWYEIWTPS